MGQEKQTRTSMKSTVIYTGKVLNFHAPPEPSYVSVKELATGKVFNINAFSQNLMEAGVGQDDEFEIILHMSDQNVGSGEMRKIKPSESFDI
jgi:hypothetical protein